MQVALPSGHKATFRDVFQRGDRRDAERGIVIVISPDGSRRMEGSLTSVVTARIIRRMLVEWDLGIPKPSDCSTDDLAEQLLDGLDDDDYEALARAVGPWTEKVLRVEQGAAFLHVPSGIRVVPASAADAARLGALPEFEREGGDPKTSSPLTAITSSESPAANGLTGTSTTQSISS